MTLRNEQGVAVPVPEAFHVYSSALGAVRIMPRGADHVFRLLHSGTYTMFFEERLIASIGPDHFGHWTIRLPNRDGSIDDILHYDSDSE